MENKWIVIRLCDFVDLATDLPCVKEELRRLFGETAEFYLPVTVDEVHGSKHLSVIIEGYIFVQEASIKDRRKLFYNQPISKNIEGPILYDEYAYQTITDAELANMKARAQRSLGFAGVSVGGKYLIAKGPFEGMEATVLSVDKASKSANISIKARTREMLMQEKISNLITENL